MRNFSLKTKESSHRNSRRERIVRLLVILAVVVILLFLLQSSVGRIASQITRPVYALKRYFEMSEAALPVYIRGRSELLAEINSLKEQIAASSGSDATIERLTEENKQLGSLIGIHDPERIGAGVLAQPPYAPYDVLYIDRGSDDGIVEGATVYHMNDHSIGFVSTVYPKSALVTLFSTPGVQTTVYVFGPNIYTTAEGEGGGVVRISVPQGISITEGNVVVMPSLDDGVLGTISTVQSASTQPEQYGYIVYTVPVQSIHRVAVGSRVAGKTSFEEAQDHVKALEEQLFKVDVPEGFGVEVATTTTTFGTSTSLVKPATTTAPQD